MESPPTALRRLRSAAIASSCAVIQPNNLAMPSHPQASVADDPSGRSTASGPASGPASDRISDELPPQRSRPLASDPSPAASAPTATNSLEAWITDDAHTLSGRYILDEVLAVGGSSIVYKARDARRADSHSSTAIAIKALRPELRDSPAAIERLKHEFRFAAALNHPSIVRVYGIEQVLGKWFLTMELLEGRSLESLLYATQPKRLSVEQAFSILMSCSNALTCAHGQGIVHRDFKPSNVWITSAQEVRVIDFGAAKSCASPLKEPISPTRSAEEPQSPHSTSAYASPQALAGDVPETSDDVFSFTCVAYELLVGRPPFGRLNAAERVRPSGDLTAPRGLPLQGWVALMRGLHYQPEFRPASVQELLNELSTAFALGNRPGRIGVLRSLRNRLTGTVRLLNSHPLARPHTWSRHFPRILTRNAIARAQSIVRSVNSHAATWISRDRIGLLAKIARTFFADIARRSKNRSKTQWKLTGHAKPVMVRARKRLQSVRNSLDITQFAATRRLTAGISLGRVSQFDRRAIQKRARRATRNRRFQHVCLSNEFMPRACRLSTVAIALALVSLPFLNRGMDSHKTTNDLAAPAAVQGDKRGIMQLAHSTMATDNSLEKVTPGVAIRSSSAPYAHSQAARGATRLHNLDFTPWQLITHSDGAFAHQTTSRNTLPPWRLGFGWPLAIVDSSSTPRAPSKPRSTITLEHASIQVSDHAVAAVLFLNRAGSTQAPATVRWRTIVGSAKPGADYQEIARGTARFTENQSVRALYIPLKLNPTAPGSRSFEVELSGPSPGAALGGIKRAVVTIQKYE
jgi:serine/threonine protein kinase